MSRDALRGARVLVTGATGFIGSRLVERLVEGSGARVRALVTGYTRAARIARFPVELVRGDVTVPEDVVRAMEGCRVAFHCAYGSRGSDAERRRVTVEGTRNVLAAAEEHRAARVVHMSTMVVYGAAVDGPLDESHPRRRSGSGYADAKVDAEELAFAYAGRGLPVTVIQPTAVYGPYAPTWTVRILETMRERRMILVDGGEGLSNPVYVDDLVTAMLAAAVAPEAPGEAFLVSGGERVTWARFLRRYEAMLGGTRTVEMTRAQAVALYRESMRRPALLTELVRIVREHPEIRARLRRTAPVSLALRLAHPVRGPAKRLLGFAAASQPAASGGRLSRRAVTPGAEPAAVQPVRPTQLDFYAAATDVRIDKAARMLGYAPAFDFERGMALTEAWARWANLLGDGMRTDG